VFQGDPWWLPGAGPLVQVPVNEMVKRGMIKSADSPIVSALLPYGASDNPIQDQFLPSWARNARSAFMQNGQEYQQVRGYLMAQERSRKENGERTTNPTPEEIDNMTRNWFILRAVTSDASPVSMSPSYGAQFYIDQAHIYKQKYDAAWSQVNGGKTWQDKYFEDFPQYYRMAITMSGNETGIVATPQAMDEASKPGIRRLIRANPQYGWAAVGPANQYGNTPGSAFSQTAYVQEEYAGLRGQSTPEVALAKVEAARGWSQYQGVMTKLNLALESRGLHSFQQKGAEDLADVKKQVEDYLAEKNDSWRQDFLSTDSGKVVNFLDWAKGAMASDKSLAARPDMQALNKYMAVRQAIQQALSSRPKHSMDNPGNADIKNAWDQINDYLRQGNIGFEQTWNRVLQHDDPSKELMGLGE
jgi:hypothetical protein